MKEQWKVIENYDKYEVSNTGYVRNRKTKKILKYQVSNLGYCYNTLSDNENNRKMFCVHRLVAKAFVDNENDYNEINHLNRNKKDNRSINLEWCTHSQNIKHSFETGRKKPNIPKGENNCNSKLKEREVKYILKSKESCVKLAKKYNVSTTAIVLIRQRKNWAHVEVD